MMEKRTIMDPDAIHYVTVGRLDEFDTRHGRWIRVEGRDLVFFRTGDNRLYALENLPLERDGERLSKGIVSGHDVILPLHNTKVNLDTGHLYSLDGRKVPTYPVYIEDVIVQVGLPN